MACTVHLRSPAFATFSIVLREKSADQTMLFPCMVMCTRLFGSFLFSLSNEHVLIPVTPKLIVDNWTDVRFGQIGRSQLTRARTIAAALAFRLAASSHIFSVGAHQQLSPQINAEIKCFFNWVAKRIVALDSDRWLRYMVRKMVALPIIGKRVDGS